MKLFRDNHVDHLKKKNHVDIIEGKINSILILEISLCQTRFISFIWCWDNKLKSQIEIIFNKCLVYIGGLPIV